MTVVLVILALLAGLAGLFTLTQATMGVGFLCGACLLGILARIAQAHAYHEEAVAERLQRRNAAPPAP